jgi:hypothetical protein
MKKRCSVAVALGVGLISLATTTVAQTPHQFDLICNDGAQIESGDDTLHVRIDLENGQWCQGDCKKFESLTTTPDTLTLRSDHTPDGDDVLTVNRRSAVLAIYTKLPMLGEETVHHQFRVAPYTGPTAKPQF